jgi:putative oxidoreductase
MHVALLVLRLGAGLLFACHGTQKLFGWFGGPGLDGAGQWFESIGLRPGRRNALAAGVNECAGGLLLAVGLLTPLAAVLIVAVMTAAVLTVHLKNGPWATNNGWELNALYGLIAFAVTAVGPGKLSLDHALGLHVTGLGWAVGALVVGVIGGAGVTALGRMASSHAAPAPG